jgi:hypothetical protein
VEQQPIEAWKVFTERACEFSTTIKECRAFMEYNWSSEALEYFKDHGSHQCINVALALQLANEWFLTTKGRGNF